MQVGIKKYMMHLFSTFAPPPQKIQSTIAVLNKDFNYRNLFCCITAISKIQSFRQLRIWGILVG